MEEEVVKGATILKIRNSVIFSVTLFAIVGCQDSEERYDAGYNDGYAVGYNTACEIRATLVEGAFDNPNYAEGYAEGLTDGVVACSSDKAAGKTSS